MKLSLFKISYGVFFIVGLVFVSAPFTFATTYLIDSYSETNKDSSEPAATGGYCGFGQSFLNTGTYYAYSAKFYLAKQGSPTGSVYAKLWPHSGTFGTNSVPIGASPLLVSSALDISTLSTSFALYELVFTSDYALSDSTHYTIEVYFAGGDGSNKLLVGEDASSPTHNGNYFSINSCPSETWGAYNGIDVPFYFYGSDVSFDDLPEPPIDSNLFGSSTATSTPTLGDVSFGLSIIIVLISLFVIAYIYNTITDKKRKPWHS